MTSGTTIGIAILAAGSSSRMGCVKQLLPWGGTTLIRSVVAQALASGLGPVAVVIGAHAARLSTELQYDPVNILANERHASGPGTSVQAAAQWAAARRLSGLVVMLGDQPRIAGPDLQRLAAVFHASGVSAIGAAYDDGAGVPALFASSLFPRLLTIPAQGGAKALLRALPDTILLPFPDALVDLDTPMEYAREQELHALTRG